METPELEEAKREAKEDREAEGYTAASFGECPECGAALQVDGEDPVSAIQPDRLIGTSKGLQSQSDDAQFATRLRCANGHRWWILTEEMRAAG